MLSDEGRFCGKCGIVLHVACHDQDVCPVCGGPWEEHERQKADPRLASVRLDAMKARSSRAFRGVVGALGGVFLGAFFVFPNGYYPEVMDPVMHAAWWLFAQWHDLGLPPDGESALLGPAIVFVALCGLIGMLIGAMFYRHPPAKIAN